jgi:hypothetical protein
VLVLITGLTACGGPGDPADIGMDVTVALSTSSAPLGDTVTVTVTAFNTTGEQLSLGFLGPCSVTFEVLDGTGNVVAPEPPICPIIDWVPTLAAGQSIGLAIEWRGERQAGTGDYLAPGTYRVRGVLDTRSGPLRGQSAILELTAAL